MHIRQLTGTLPQPVRFGLRKIAFAGTGQRCPLCRSHIRQLVAHGGGADVLDRRQVVGGMRREKDRCPVCHGQDRSRMMMLYLQRETELGQRPLRVLHVAPDFGLYLWLKRQASISYTGTDIDAKRYRHIEGIQTADLTALPFDDNAFDIIVCSHVLEHVPDDSAAFSELFRVLAPQGHALLLTPYALDDLGTDEDPEISDPKERHRRFGLWDHVRIYDRGDFLNRMRSAGFETTLYDPCAVNPEAAAALHLNAQECLPVGRKALLT
ncbi:MAG: hypothetical protein Kilf2KO_06290 [Rhodospirillales bacterium]